MRFTSALRSSKASRTARGALAALALLHLTCNQAILTAPGDSEMQLFANPGFIPSNGGVSIISARVVEAIGTPVADGTVVSFFTTLGRIPEQAKTNDGVARVNLIADSRSGTATVTAFSGPATATTDVAIGGGIPPETILLTAAPERLTDRRASTITATVTDANGNPIANIAVVFTIASVTPFPPTGRPEVADEFMESRGSPVFTDNNGVATDVMRTNRPFGDTQFAVTVRGALLVGGKSETVVVIVN